MRRLAPKRILFALALTTSFELACGDTRPSWSAEELEVIASLSPVGTPPPSPGNRYADDERAAELGRRFFFDTGLSRTNAVSCATCHRPQSDFTDGRSLAFGITEGTRNTPSLLGAAWFTHWGWDGHTDSLWAQSLSALASPAEHDVSPREVSAHVEAHHLDAYVSVFGAWPSERTPAHHEQVFVNVGKALEAYVRRLLPGPAPFDHYVEALRAGDPSGGGHLSLAEQRGLRDFLRSGCVSCHHGPMFTDDAFHNLGLPPSIGTSDLHPGRSHGARELLASHYRCGTRFSDATRCDELRFLDPTFSDFEGAFKTPSLRNVAQTGPYMHTGQFATLEAVIEHYRQLPGAARVGRRDPQLRPLGRSISTHDLAAFLRTLTGPLPEARWLSPP